MKRNLIKSSSALLIILGFTLMFPWNKSSAQQPTNNAHDFQNAYDFQFESLGSDTPIKLEQFRGKVIMVVNTASKCGFTNQYSGLEALYKKYQDRGLIIIGVPSNDFGGQEPGTSEEIAHFCQLNYGVSFPMTKKTVVKGETRHPFYKWAHDVLGFGTAPKWNFHKYLIDRQGRLVNYFHSTTSPESGSLVRAIEALLDGKESEMTKAEEAQ